MDGIYPIKFVKYLEALKEKYADDFVVRKNGTLLLGRKNVSCESLFSKHKLFKPLDDDLIDEYLIKEYMLKFPQEYAGLLKYTNGADLYNIRKNVIIKNKEFKITQGLLTIYGLPRTPPYSRPLDMEEPYDVRHHDITSDPNLPNTWLNCGMYNKPPNFSDPFDIYIDTVDESVYGCNRKTSQTDAHWKSLDECLCQLVELFSTAKDEY